MIRITATDLPRVMQCVGSLNMVDTLPPEAIDQTTRDEGVAAHWLAEKHMKEGVNLSYHEGHKAPNGIFITAEMIEHVAEYVDGINRGGQFDGTEVETVIQGNNFQINNRADHINFSANILYIDDFKYGHRIVEVRDNWTLIAHAIGFCITYGVAPEIITFTIYQPRARHRDGTRREYSVPYETLVNFYYPHIYDTLENPSNILTTGPNCIRCPFLPYCPAASAAGFSAIEESTIAFSDNITNEQLASELDLLKVAEKRLSARRDALENLAKHRLREGQAVKGYTLEQGQGNTAWKKHVNPQMLKALTGFDLTTSKLMTPSAAKRHMKNDTLWSAVAKVLTERPATGAKLKRVDVDTQATKLLNQQPKG